MTVEELLIDRYIVTAPYPQSTFEVGDILYVYKFKTSSLGMYTYVTNPERPLQGSNAKPEYVESMPHLFRKLNGWEERKVEDMPDYVKWDVGIYPTWKKIMKVDKWNSNGSFDHENVTISVINCFPATEQQYNDYINSKSNAKH